MEADTSTRQGLQVLRDLHLTADRLRYPNVPEYGRVIPNYTDKTANGLTKCIIDFIRLNNFQSERINCTGRVIDRRKTYTDVLGHSRTVGSIDYVKTSGQTGTADISATIQGRSVKIEVKIGRDRQRPEQIEYQKQIEASGGLYFIATDFEQFFTWYQKSWGVL